MPRLQSSVGIYSTPRSSIIGRGSLVSNRSSLISNHSLESDDYCINNDNPSESNQFEEEEVEWLDDDHVGKVGGFVEEADRRSFSQYTALITRRYG